MPYWEDTDKKDQGWALLDEGYAPPVTILASVHWWRPLLVGW
jgi:hypothetical protein